MKLHLSTRQTQLNASIAISGSKSESNRLLILQQLVARLQIENLSDSDDSNHLQHALTTKEEVVDIGHAGTAMRFLTAYFATKEGREVVLTGSERMQNRPIEILVNALQDLGAQISYEDKVGYPPIRIKGTRIVKDKVQINGNVSSQYISALMLVASSLPNGLEIELLGEITSVPYINMTLKLLHELGIDATFIAHKISIKHFSVPVSKKVVVESDWSSASYFYSCIALSDLKSQVVLSAYKKDSLQGDSCLSEIYKHFGVETTFQDNTITLTKVRKAREDRLILDLKNAPDIAQTIAVTCFGLAIDCTLTGLHTLKIKETDRLVALENELTKLGGKISITDERLELEKATQIHKDIAIETYKDHRMAMAFAPLALKTSIVILEAKVVTKSFRNFWDTMQQIGFQIREE
ncbi:MAG: 3-phosphoshikimate 1-carboxyvinyltransferase [Polaribacter sp.]